MAAIAPRIMAASLVRNCCALQAATVTETLQNVNSLEADYVAFIRGIEVCQLHLLLALKMGCTKEEHFLMS